MTYQTSISPNSRRQELQEKIEEIEQGLRRLREQLRAEEETDQHAVIENIDVYLGDIDHKYANLRTFWLTIREELRNMVSNGTRDDQEK